MHQFPPRTIVWNRVSLVFPCCVFAGVGKNDGLEWKEECRRSDGIISCERNWSGGQHFHRKFYLFLYLWDSKYELEVEARRTYFCFRNDDVRYNQLLRADSIKNVRRICFTSDILSNIKKMTHPDDESIWGSTLHILRLSILIVCWYIIYNLYMEYAFCFGLRLVFIRSLLYLDSYFSCPLFSIFPRYLYNMKTFKNHVALMY